MDIIGYAMMKDGFSKRYNYTGDEVAQYWQGTLNTYRNYTVSFNPMDGAITVRGHFPGSGITDSDKKNLQLVFSFHIDRLGLSDDFVWVLSEEPS